MTNLIRFNEDKTRFIFEFKKGTFKYLSKAIVDLLNIVPDFNSLFKISEESSDSFGEIQVSNLDSNKFITYTLDLHGSGYGFYSDLVIKYGSNSTKNLKSIKIPNDKEVFIDKKFIDKVIKFFTETLENAKLNDNLKSLEEENRNNLIKLIPMLTSIAQSVLGSDYLFESSYLSSTVFLNKKDNKYSNLASFDILKKENSYYVSKVQLSNPVKIDTIYNDKSSLKIIEEYKKTIALIEKIDSLRKEIDDMLALRADVQNLLKV